MQNINQNVAACLFRLKESYSKCLTRLLALVLLVLSISLQGLNGHAAQVPSGNNRAVSLNVTVTNNKNGYGWGLDKDVFSIFVDKEQQEIVSFKAEDLPISVGILVDASGSMKESDPQGPAYSKAISQALTRFVKASNPGNEYFLLSFSDQPQLLLDWTSDTAAVSQATVSIKKHAPTALYDSWLQAIRKLDQAKNKKRALVLISDGNDNSSHHKLNEVSLALQKRSDIIFYALGFGADSGFFGINRGGVEPAGIHVITSDLAKVAAETGGKAFFPDSASVLNSNMEGLAVELRHQYLISFVPVGPLNDGKWHAIKVKVTPKPGAPSELQHLNARAPEGFYSNKQ